MNPRVWWLAAGCFAVVVAIVLGRFAYERYRAPRFECRKDSRSCFVNICEGEAVEDAQCFDRESAFCYAGQQADAFSNCWPTRDECDQKRMFWAKPWEGSGEPPGPVPVAGATCREIHADEK